jgi:hypothetical protein
MKYICLGYPENMDDLSENDRNAMLDDCLKYNDELLKNGHSDAHFAGGEALQPSNTAVTVSGKNGKVAVTDGPYLETKEQIGGILVVEARDLNHAIQLMSQHPAVKYGRTFEIRAAADMEMIRERARRPGKDT